MASPNKKLDPKGTGATPSGEGVLANFFNSLLYKKSGVPPGSPGTPGSVGASPIKIGTRYTVIFIYNDIYFAIIPHDDNVSYRIVDSAPVDKATMCNDAVAELDRLTRTKKLSPPNLNSSSEC